MQRAFLRLGQWLLIAALFSATGAQWLALQSIAWGTMLVAYARHDSLPVAIEKTFDGRHPCDLCKVIAREKQTEKQTAAVISVAKMDWFHEPRKIVMERPEAPWVWREEAFLSEARCEAPPLPPPRGLVG